MLCVLRRQRRAYDIRGFEFALGVQMGIDIARRTYIRMPEPFLDHLHRHLFGQQKKGAGVPEFVEADMPESVFLEQKREVLRNIVRPVQSSESVCADIVLKIRTVSFTESLFHFLPEPDLIPERLLNDRDQRERTVTVLSLPVTIQDETYDCE